MESVDGGAGKTEGFVEAPAMKSTGGGAGGTREAFKAPEVKGSEGGAGETKEVFRVPTMRGAEQGASEAGGSLTAPSKKDVLATRTEETFGIAFVGTSRAKASVEVGGESAKAFEASEMRGAGGGAGLTEHMGPALAPLA